ncbi:MAG: S8 family serine peptidase, partial [Bacteroidota bacterium]
MRHVHARHCLLLLLCMTTVELLAQLHPFQNKPFQSKEAIAHTSREGYYFLNIRFERMPNPSMLSELADAGVELLNYQRENVYGAKLPIQLSPNELRELGIAEVYERDFRQKMTAQLLERSADAWHSSKLNDAAKSLSRVEVALIFHRGVVVEQKQELLESFGAALADESWEAGRVRVVQVLERQLEELARHPLIAFVDDKPENAVKLNHENRIVQKVNTLNAPVSIGGKDLRGQGVVIGVGDGGELGQHIDFGDRVTNKANGTYAAYGAHGDHVSGIVGSAGNLNPRHRGIAPESELITQKTTMITYRAADYYEDLGMVLTNNSYGVNFNCETNGSYNSTSQNLDEQLNALPEMLHVFAAGNSGSQSCDGYPKGFKSVLRYYAAAKNALTVGAVDENRVIANLSSRGPVMDGRLKPEIVGTGMNVISTGRENNYFISGGTSMAAPSVTATLALFYQRYRELNDGQNPEGGLVKAIACNTADDLGNAGPDYTYGYGIINGRRGIACLENRQYQINEVEQDQTIQHRVVVPQGVQQLKIMLYWTDQEGEAYAEKTLVSDLDLTVSGGGEVQLRPWVLNPAPDKVDQPATRGRDELNNIEQVTIDQPAAGEYQINVSGSRLPFGARRYFITYDFVYPEVVLTHPFAQEVFMPGSKESIQWDADITNTHNFTIDYTTNNGSSWTLIADNVPATQRNYQWTV